MPAQVVERTATGFTVQITVSYSRSMLEFEETLQKELNAAGVLATEEGLQQFDTDGSPITVGSVTLTTKGQSPKDYQTPYGVATVARHVYQSSAGGTTYCPLERDARIIITSTPKFAKMVSSKYASFGSPGVVRDLLDNHGRKASRCLIQDVADAVAAVALAKEEDWSYHLPKLDKPVQTVAVSMDGTCTFLCDDGFRETMVGTISFYDREGERQHTVYLAATPEYGKATFLDRLAREVEQAKQKHPKACWVGIADGAKCNWEFLQAHTQSQVVDFWHAAKYLGEAAAVFYPAAGQKGMREAWLEESCHTLKHEAGGAATILKQLKSMAAGRPWAKDHEAITSAITYFENQSAAGRMDYASHVKKNQPIGSGVTEAACKTVVKQRLCCSGMKWKDQGAAAVLSLRCLNQTEDRWTQFWGKIDRWGFPVAA
jgi:hypothetical protein